MKQVLSRALRHAGDVLGSGGVILLAILDQIALQIGHGITTANTFPQLGWWYELRDASAGRKAGRNR